MKFLFIDTHPNPRQFWDGLCPITPEDFTARLSEGLPEGGTLRIDFTSPDSIVFHLAICEDSKIMLNTTRSFTPANGIGDHILTEIDPDWQGNGLAARLEGNYIQLMREIGLRQINIHACLTDGAYIWARHGYAPTSKAWQELRGEIRDRVNELRHQHILAELNGVSRPPLPETALDLADKLCGETDPKTIWTIADLAPQVEGRKLGRRLLWRQNWQGTLDLRDPQAMARQRAAVSRVKKTARSSALPLLEKSGR